MSIVMVASSTHSYADVIRIPMSTKVEKFKEIMKSKGVNLDGGDEADGFVQDYGTRMDVVTYKSLDTFNLNDIMDAAVEARR